MWVWNHFLKKKKNDEKERTRMQGREKDYKQVFLLISQLGEQKTFLENNLAFFSFFDIKEMLVGKLVNDVLVQKFKAALELFRVFQVGLSSFSVALWS